VSYVVLPEHQGRGYAGAALPRVTDWVFATRPTLAQLVAVPHRHEADALSVNLEGEPAGAVHAAALCVRAGRVTRTTEVGAQLRVDDPAAQHRPVRLVGRTDPHRTGDRDGRRQPRVDPPVRRACHRCRVDDGIEVQRPVDVRVGSRRARYLVELPTARQPVGVNHQHQQRVAHLRVDDLQHLVDLVVPGAAVDVALLGQ
jgi:hypothetical protein